MSNSITVTLTRTQGQQLINLLYRQSTLDDESAIALIRAVDEGLNLAICQNLGLEPNQSQQDRERSLELTRLYRQYRSGNPPHPQGLF